MPNTQLITVTLDGGKRREPILLGHESQALVPYYVQFDIAAWREHFGDGAAALLHQRKGDANPYVVSVTTEGNIVTWQVSNVDNGTLGTGRCELLYYVSGKAVKSDVWLTRTLPALGVEINPPDPYESSIEQVAALAAQISADAETTERAAERAEKVTDQTWVAAVLAAGEAAEKSAESADESNREAQQAKADLQDALDGVSQETTAKEILAKLIAIADTTPEEASRAARAAAAAEDSAEKASGAAAGAEDFAERARASAAGAKDSADRVSDVVDDLQDALDGVSQETTAKEILAKLIAIAEHAPAEASAAARAAAAAEEAAARAKDAVTHPPIIGDNGNWYEWDADTGEYVDSGHYSGGQPVIYGSGLILDEPTRTVSVDTATAVRSGDARPVTSNAVNEVVGNITALLETI